MTHASVFSGIGGPEVAATMLGWENLFHCEINPFGRAVLDYWYPNAKSYDDITKTDFTEWRGRVDVLTGGFPCQPFSYAGQRRGAEDDRYLWPYMFKCIDAIRPAWVVAENVGGILTMVEQGEVSEVGVQGSLFGEEDVVRGYELRETFTLERICDDLETHGYAVQPVLVPACAVGAPHRRDRVFIVGRRRDGFVADPDNGADGRAAGANEGEGRAQRLQERHEIREPDEPNQVRREGGLDAENAVCDGLQRGHSEEQGCERDERNAGAGDSEWLCDEGTGLGDTRHFANTADPRLQGRHDCDTQGHGQGSDGCTRQPCEVSGRAGDATDTDMLGRRGGRLCVDSQGYGQTEDGLFEAFRGMYNDGVRRQRESDVCGERWMGFPTVSPVHRGNDGLPFPLDDLTLSPAKWRTEALKAYGNAIVPQVMYEIFRAIEIAEKHPDLTSTEIKVNFDRNES